MNYIIKNRKPEQVFRFFEEISAIPRGSGNEKGIADYLVGFAGARGLDCYRDKVNNVFIKAPATAGRENEPAILFQAHTDMVCEKNAGTEHDFLHDGLELFLDGKFLRARGTTLGADDGIGVATMLALLDGAVASHPAYECLFTVSEETGMDGVNNFDFSKVAARRLVNLDSAGISEAVAGCAGGSRLNLTVSSKRIPSSGSALEITLGGLAGGHSGENINDGRANANKLMGRILLALREVTGYSVASINGGGKSNAIPRECRAVVVTGNLEAVRKCVAKLADEIMAEVGKCDEGCFVRCEDVELPAYTFDERTTKNAVNLLGTAANGVLEMSKKIDGFVEYSRNLGVIATNKDSIVFTFFARSAIDGQLEASNRELEALASMCGATVEYAELYHGWNYESVSPVRDAYAAAYKKVTGNDLKIVSIHAGLECGLIKAEIPDMDIISVGPDEIDIHSPDETLDLDTVETLFAVIAGLLTR